MNEVVYTSGCEMYRVVAKDGAFYPQERRAVAVGWGKLTSRKEIDEFRSSGRWMVQEGPFEGWYLGRTCRGASKGYKSYKTLNAAIKFIEGAICHE